MASRFVIIQANSLGSSGFTLPPSSVITGIGFALLIGAEDVCALASAPFGTVDTDAALLTSAVLAIAVSSATVPVNIFYDGLKIRLKDDQQIFTTGSFQGYAFVRVETPDS